jgi:hypothetical protein
MSTTNRTSHANEVIVIDDGLDPGGGAVVVLGLTNQDGSDTFQDARSLPTRPRSLRPLWPRRLRQLARGRARPRRRSTASTHTATR